MAEFWNPTGPVAPAPARRKVLVRADSGGGTHGFLEWLTAPSRRLHYSVGMTVTEDIQAALLKVPATVLRHEGCGCREPRPRHADEVPDTHRF